MQIKLELFFLFIWILSIHALSHKLDHFKQIYSQKMASVERVALENVFIPHPHLKESIHKLFQATKVSFFKRVDRSWNHRLSKRNTIVDFHLQLQKAWNESVAFHVKTWVARDLIPLTTKLQPPQDMAQQRHNPFLEKRAPPVTPRSWIQFVSEFVPTFTAAASTKPRALPKIDSPEVAASLPLSHPATSHQTNQQSRTWGQYAYESYRAPFDLMLSGFTDAAKPKIGEFATTGREALEKELPDFLNSAAVKKLKTELNGAGDDFIKHTSKEIQNQLPAARKVLEQNLEEFAKSKALKDLQNALNDATDDYIKQMSKDVQKQMDAFLNSKPVKAVVYSFFSLILLLLLSIGVNMYQIFLAIP